MTATVHQLPFAPFPKSPDVAAQYPEALQDPAVIHKSAQAIGQLIRDRQYRIEQPLKHFMAPAPTGLLEAQFGLVVHAGSQPVTHEPAIVSAGRFAASLHEYFALPPDEAVSTAAIYTTTFGLFIRGFQRSSQTLIHTASKPAEPQIWPPIELAAKQKLVAHRVAGAVAKSTLIAPLTAQDNTPEQPYPLHIAGLLDPIPAYEAKTFHSLFTKAVK